MTEPPAFRRYLGRFAALTLAWLAGVAALNLLADPYMIWGEGQPEGMGMGMGVGMAKPRASRQVGLARAKLVERVRPNTLLLGNSRVEVGFDPLSTQWPQEFRPVFNLSQPGYAVEAPVLLLRHAAATRVPDRVFLAIDFVDFLVSNRPPSAGPTPLEARMKFTLGGDPNPDFASNRLKDQAKSLASLTALRDSVMTLAAQFNDNADTMTPLGFNPLRSAIDATRIEGYYEFFQQKNITYAERYGSGRLRLAGSQERPFALLDQLIAFCEQRNIEITLFTHPYHADFLEILRLAGHWTAFEEWKRTITQTVTAAQARKAKILLWDFSGYHRRAAEAVPARRDRKSVMQWYWESGHYKKELGEAMIVRMLNQPAADRDLGVILTPANVETVLQALREQQQRYAESHAEAMERVSTLFQKTARRR